MAWYSSNAHDLTYHNSTRVRLMWTPYLVHVQVLAAYNCCQLCMLVFSWCMNLHVPSKIKPPHAELSVSSALKSAKSCTDLRVSSISIFRGPEWTPHTWVGQWIFSDIHMTYYINIWCVIWPMHSCACRIWTKRVWLSCMSRSPCCVQTNSLWSNNVCYKTLIKHAPSSLTQEFRIVL